MKILLSNIGRRTYLLDFISSNQDLLRNHTFYISDTDSNCAGFHHSPVFKKLTTPRIQENEEFYANELLKIAIENDIELIFPLNDFELPIISKKKNKFLENGIQIVVSDSSFINNCLSKLDFSTYCQGNKIPTPRVIAADSFEKLEFPLVRKRNKGSGSVGLKFVTSKLDLHDFDSNTEILQECIKGVEYGADIMHDLNGKLISISIRKKLLIRNGETDQAETVYDEKIEQELQRISQITNHVGNLDLDFIQNSDGINYFLDFNPRLGGGYPLSHLAGLDLIESLVMQKMGKEIRQPFRPRKIRMFKGISIYKEEI